MTEEIAQGCHAKKRAQWRLLEIDAEISGLQNTVASKLDDRQRIDALEKRRQVILTDLTNPL
jgi:hypothetical protein